MDYAALATRIKEWGRTLGFQAVGIADTELSEAENRLGAWLGRGWHGEMDYMARHGALRARPGELVPGTVRVISCRMDYLPQGAGTAEDPLAAGIARYARGRDYHKVLRARLQELCERIRAETGPFGYRVFADSAPVMEVELATKAGIGWRGKHTLLLSREAGSWFFLGEVYTSLPLPADAPESEHCGTCTKCIDVCPTQAIRAPYRLDARRCISYLTIEHKGAIPEALRALPRRLPDRRLSRALPLGRHALHLVPHHRAQGAHRARIPRRHRQPHLRLRRLPGGMPVEQVCFCGRRNETEGACRS